MEDGYQVQLANPAAIRQYEGLKYSGDFTDAAHLAQLLRLGLLPEGYIYPAEERPVLDLSRKRMQLVRCRTAQILSIENLLSRQTGQRMTEEVIKHLSDEQVNALGFALDVTLAMQANLAVMRTLQEEIAILQKRLMERVQLRPDYCAAEVDTRCRPRTGDNDHARDGRHHALCRRWQFQLILSLSG